MPDVSLEIGLIRAYHRHMEDFCGAATRPPEGADRRLDPRRRRGGEEIRAGAPRNGRSRCSRCSPNEPPVDHPDLEPIWRAAEDHDLAIVHHSFTWSPPYFPGYTDMWDNVYLARLCSHPWGAMRFMAGFLAGGILDRYPGLRLCVLECGFGWLPFWVRRMDEQVSYVGRTAQLKLLPSEQFAAGRVFCNIEAHEHEPMFEMVTQALGDGVPDVRLRLPAFRNRGSPTRSTRSWSGTASPASAPRSCSGTTPTAASSRREEGAMKRVDIAAYGVPEEVASCVEVPDVGAPGRAKSCSTCSPFRSTRPICR